MNKVYTVCSTLYTGPITCLSNLLPSSIQYFVAILQYPHSVKLTTLHSLCKLR